MQDGFWVVQASDKDCALYVHGGKEAIRCSHICTHYLVIMVVDDQWVVIIRSLFQVPDFNCLVHWARNQFCIVDQNLVYVIIMCLEFVYANSSLETKDVDVIIFSCECKRFLTRELTGHTDTTIAHEKWFSTCVAILLNVQFIHFDEAICACRNKFQSVHVMAIYENHKRYLVFLNEFHKSIAILKRADSV